MLNAVLLACAAVALSACASTLLDDRVGAADDLARSRGWAVQDLSAAPFTLRSYAPIAPHAPETDLLTIYIEGDGLAWVSRYRPALDPTPDDPVSLKMALNAPPGGAVAYLGRPCQYTLAWDRAVCDVKYWTYARYAEEVVQSMNAAVTQLKAAHGASRIRLVGYSGGGVVAALLAARRRDVVQLVTVAANLDTEYWTRLHEVTPLFESLNPARDKRLASVPQVHFVGAEDDIVPPSVVRSYLRSIGLDPQGTLHIIAGAGHECCWDEKWPDMARTWLAARP